LHQLKFEIVFSRQILNPAYAKHMPIADFGVSSLKQAIRFSNPHWYLSLAEKWKMFTCVWKYIFSPHYILDKETAIRFIKNT